MNIVKIVLSKLSRIPDDKLFDPTKNIDFLPFFMRTEFDSLIFLIGYTIRSNNIRLKLIILRTVTNISKSQSNLLICNIVNKSAKGKVPFDVKLLILDNFYHYVDKSIHYENTLFLLLDSFEFESLNPYNIHYIYLVLKIVISDIKFVDYILEKIKIKIKNIKTIDYYKLNKLLTYINKNENINENGIKVIILIIKNFHNIIRTSTSTSTSTIENFLYSIIDRINRNQVLHQKQDDSFNIVILRKIEKLKIASKFDTNINIIEKQKNLDEIEYKRKYLRRSINDINIDCISSILDLDIIVCRVNFYTTLCNCFLESNVIIFDNSNFISIYSIIIIENKYRSLLSFFEKYNSLNVVLFKKIKNMMDKEKYIIESLVFLPDNFAESEESISMINKYLFSNNKLNCIFYSKFCKYILQSEIIANNHSEIKSFSDALIVKLKYHNILTYINKYNLYKDSLLFRKTSLIFSKTNYQASKKIPFLTDGILYHIITYLVKVNNN
jgi:hypothetical protein